ncbi:MAG TPA: MXAN_6640 family putative metalloprotease [Bacteroidota bacterium]|nr:MXAN_6640 family putative metalloprotease [Bacteroidota bacterium]
MSPRLAVILIFLAIPSVISFARGEHSPLSGTELAHLIRQADAIYGRGALASGYELSDEVGKCGLGIRFGIEAHWTEFTPSQRLHLQQILDPPPLEANKIIGKFRIYYDTSTSAGDVPALIYIDSTNTAQRIPGTAEAYVDSVGRYFNYAWAYEIDTLGYLAPPLDTDGYFHIYVTELGNSGEYGSTNWDSPAINSGQPPRYRTFIYVDNDFADPYIYMPSRGIPGLKVTAAHEFHHAIQIGSYGVWANDFYFYEITSTWMEGVLFNEVKDYVQYLWQYDPVSQRYVAAGQFATPDVSFNGYTGLIEYSRCIWGKFVQKKYSRDVMRRTWEYMESTASLPSIDAALNEYGSSLHQAFLEWGLWNLNTGPNSDSVKYYPDAHIYPLMTTRPDVAFTPPSRSFTDTIQALSSAYHPICLLDSLRQTCSTSPKMVAIISNLNSSAAGNGLGYGFQYDISTSGDNSYKPLGNGLFVRLTTPDPVNWATQEIETDSGSVVPIVPQYTEPLTCPNPFIPHGNKPLSFRIPTDPTNPATAFLAIFTSSLDKVFSRELSLHQTSCGNGVEWDGHNDRGETIATGVYIFVVDVNGKQYTGKFSVVSQ